MAVIDGRTTSGGAYRKVGALSCVLLSIMAVVGTVSGWGLVHVKDDVDELVGRRMVAQEALLRVEVELQTASSLIEAAQTITRLDERTEVLAAHDAAVTRARLAWEDFSLTLGPQRRAFPSAAGFEVMRAAWLESIATVKSELLSDRLDRPTDWTARVGLGRDRFAVMMGQLAVLDDEAFGASFDAQADDTVSDIAVITALVLVLGTLGFAVGLVVSRQSIRASRAQQRELEARDAARLQDESRIRHESRLNRALEYARTESVALETVTRALTELFPERESELLLADSSRAHLRQVLATTRDGFAKGCGVSSPSECPAVNKGHSLQFETNEAFDVCPQLRDRMLPPCSAVCVPVAINGASMGVLHSLGAPGVVLDRERLFELELVAARAGDRIGVLRAFSQSESQAATDPLTGLMNRRAFENGVGELLAQRVGLTLAYGDLDQFKKVNDVYGHPTGDRALRMFARVLRDSVRSDDLVARWGGEEFVLALPDATPEVARAVLDRIRAGLANVSSLGTIPPLTVSFGMADWRETEDFDRLVHLADERLLLAKSQGRDCVVDSSEPTRWRRAETKETSA